MKFFKDLRTSIAEGRYFHGYDLGGPGTVYGLNWDCNLEKRAREYKLAEATNPADVMANYPTRGWTVAQRQFTANPKTNEVSLMLRDMLSSQGGSKLCLLAYPFISRVGCSTYVHKYTNRTAVMRIGCIYDSKPPNDFKIVPLTEEKNSTYCKSDDDCTHIPESKCRDKLCIAPPYSYVNGH